MIKVKMSYKDKKILYGLMVKYDLVNKIWFNVPPINVPLSGTEKATKKVKKNVATRVR